MKVPFSTLCCTQPQSHWFLLKIRTFKNGSDLLRSYNNCLPTKRSQVQTPLSILVGVSSRPKGSVTLTLIWIDEGSFDVHHLSSHFLMALYCHNLIKSKILPTCGLTHIQCLGLSQNKWLCVKGGQHVLKVFGKCWGSMAKTHKKYQRQNWSSIRLVLVLVLSCLLLEIKHKNTKKRIQKNTKKQKKKQYQSISRNLSLQYKLYTNLLMTTNTRGLCSVSYVVILWIFI